MEIKHIYIPVGWRCDAAGRLRKNGLRKTAYPFDWTIKHYNSMYYMLTKGMKDFLKGYTIGPKTYSAFYEDKSKGTKNLQSVFCHKSQAILVHDYQKGGDIEKVKQKYIKRYNRLISDIKEADKITLVTDEYNGKIWVEMVNVYKKRLGINIKEVWNQTKTIDDIVEAVQSHNPNALVETVSYNTFKK